MLSILRRLVATPAGSPSHTAYIALVMRARNPFFYEVLGVPDTIDGRFELILLHLFLLQHRLLQETGTPAKAAENFSRELGELFFADMDRSLREIGVADTGVRYRIKAMAKAYHGRLQVYTAAIGAREALKTALARNVYGTLEEGSPALLDNMADYAQAMQQALASADIHALLAAQLPEPELA